VASESAAQLKWVKYVLIGSGLAIGWFLMFVIGGASFILVHFTIVILLWVAAPLESRQDPLPDRMLDRLFDIKEQIESPSLSRAATN